MDPPSSGRKSIWGFGQSVSIYGTVAPNLENTTYPLLTAKNSVLAPQTIHQIVLLEKKDS
jgi:hypothetical protein